MRSPIAAAVCLASVLFALSASPARAGNDDPLLIGDEAVLTGGAVTAIVKTGAGLWYNPAGLARVDRDTVDVSGTAYSLRLYKVPQFLRLFGGETSDANITEVIVIPTAVTYVRPFKKARVGLGIFVADSSDVTLRSQIQAPRPALGVVEWLLAVTDESERYHAVAGAAWRLNENVSLGFSVHGIYAAASGSAQFAGGNNDGSPLSGSLISASVGTALSETALGFAGSVGFQWQVTESFVLGASVLSPVTIFWVSNTESTVLTAVNLINDPPSSVFDTSDTTSSEWGLEAILPTRVRFGFAYQHPRFTLSFDGDIQHKLSNPDVGVDRRAVWNARVGAIFHVNAKVDVGAGVFTDRNAERGVDQVGDFDLEYYGFSLGVSYLNDRKLDTEAENKERLTFGTSFGFRYALGKGDVGGLLLTDDFAEPNAFFLPFRTKITIHELAVYLGTKFLF